MNCLHPGLVNQKQDSLQNQQKTQIALTFFNDYWLYLRSFVSLIQYIPVGAIRHTSIDRRSFKKILSQKVWPTKILQHKIGMPCTLGDHSFQRLRTLLMLSSEVSTFLTSPKVTYPPSVILTHYVPS